MCATLTKRITYNSRKDKGSPSEWLTQWFPAHTHTKAQTKTHPTGAQQDRGEREREKETEMLLNSFIVQMNENHINASGQGRASVSELTQQLREEANEVRGSVWR